MSRLIGQLGYILENLEFINQIEANQLQLQLISTRVRIRTYHQTMNHLCTNCLCLHTYQTRHDHCTVCRNTEYQHDFAYLIISWLNTNNLTNGTTSQ